MVILSYEMEHAKYEHKLSTYLIDKILNSFVSSKVDNDYNAILEKFNSISRITTFYSTRFYQLFIDLPFMLVFLYLIYIFGGILVLVPISLSFFYVITMIIVSIFLLG